MEHGGVKNNASGKELHGGGVKRGHGGEEKSPLDIKNGIEEKTP